jgi:leucyl aminopeptidase
MKEIIKIELKTRKVDFVKCETELLCVGMFSDAKGLDKLCQEIDGKFDGAIGKLIDIGDFKGTAGSCEIIYGNNQIGAKRILLLGLGEKNKVTLDTIRQAAANAASKAVELKAKTVSLALHAAIGGKFDIGETARVIAEGAYLGSYRYDEFVTKSENERPEKLAIELIDSDSAKLKKIAGGLAIGIIIGEAQSYARTLANRPANVISPAVLAEEAKKLAKETPGLSCTVFDEKQLETKGMGGILAVGSGSKNKPCLIVLKYTPKDGAKQPTIALVGKAITFDSGGISIKPSADMDQMKFDKSGGIAVLGTMKAIAQMGLKLNVYGLIPSAENLPSGTSYRPGDIVTTFSGKTVEIMNTDAEGRMILCDALNYAAKQKCDVIIDIATLTGACVVALGNYMAGVMGNDEKLIKQLQLAAEKSGEKVWPLPSGEEYLEEMKSKIADLKNTGGKWGGACTAAAFLRQFVEDKKWAHIDMAGVDMFEGSSKRAGAVGSTGYGVRLLTSYVMNAAKKK